MKEAISTSKAKGGSALIMNAKSGEILAMVSYPTFNPNNPERVIERNKVVDDFFEPGSLIKPVTVAGALKLGHIQKDSVINTNPGFVTKIKRWNIFLVILVVQFYQFMMN